MRLGQGDFYRDAKAIRAALGLGQPSGWLPFTAYQSLPDNVSSSSTIVFAATVPRAMVVRSYHQAVYVATTNNGSNYWTITLRKNSGTTITTVDTSAISASAWTLLASTGLSYALVTSDVGIQIILTKTGAPGTIDLGAPAVWVT